MAMKNLKELADSLRKALASTDDPEAQRTAVAADGDKKEKKEKKEEPKKEASEPEEKKEPADGGEKTIELSDDDVVQSGELPEITEEEVQHQKDLDSAEPISDEEVQHQADLDSAEPITDQDVTDQLELDSAEPITDQDVQHQVDLDSAEPISDEEVQHQADLDSAEPISDEEVQHQADLDSAEPISDEDVQHQADLDSAEPITDQDVVNEISQDMKEVKDDYAEPEEITDQDLIDSGLLEEITEEDLQQAREGAEKAVQLTDEDMQLDNPENEPAPKAPAVDPVSPSGAPEEGDEYNSEASAKATAKATKLLASANFKFRTDSKGRIVVAEAGDVEELPEVPAENQVEVVHEVPEDLQVNSDQVNLILNNPESEDPFYTILIEGEPVATIHLEDQENGEEKKDFFVSEEYPAALTTAMVKGGVKSVLAASKAREFAVCVRASKVAQDMKAEARAELRKDIDRKVEAAKSKFVDCVNLAIAGMNKNFFTNDNDLKAAVYDVAASFGASKEQAMAATEKVFERSGSYFKSVVAKAEELMSFDNKAFETVASAVAAAGTAARQVETFSSRMVRGNTPVVAGFHREGAKVEASAQPAPHKVLKFHAHTK